MMEFVDVEPEGAACGLGNGLAAHGLLLELRHEEGAEEI